MRRRPAAVLLGAFVMITGTYMAWCALPCVRPCVFYDANVPNEARQAIHQWRKKSIYLEPAPPRYFLESLCDPFEIKLRWVTVKMDAFGRARVDDRSLAGIYLRTGCQREMERHNPWLLRPHSSELRCSIR